MSLAHIHKTTGPDKWTTSARNGSKANNSPTSSRTMTTPDAGIPARF
jgi:hypothetical protein